MLSPERRATVAPWSAGDAGLRQWPCVVSATRRRPSALQPRGSTGCGEASRPCEQASAPVPRGRPRIPLVANPRGSRKSDWLRVKPSCPADALLAGRSNRSEGTRDRGARLPVLRSSDPTACRFTLRASATVGSAARSGDSWHGVSITFSGRGCSLAAPMVGGRCSSAPVFAPKHLTVRRVPATPSGVSCQPTPGSTHQPKPAAGRRGCPWSARTPGHRSPLAG